MDTTDDLDIDIKDKLQYTGEAVKTIFPDTAFALILFDPGIIGGTVQYVSNVDEPTFVAALKEIVASMEGRRFSTPEMVQ